MAPRCMGSAWRPRSWCGRWAHWRRAWASVLSPGCSRWTRTRCCSGWSRWRTMPQPFPSISCTTCVSRRSNWMNSLRCSARCRPARQRAQGPAPKPRWMPLPGLLYAQVVKTVRRRRLVRVRHRVVFGTLEAVQQVLAACGWQINTAFIERLNLTIRQHVAAVGRRVSTLCKGEDGVRQQLALYHGYDNFCLPHTSVRQPLLQPEPTHGTGSATQWRPCTPAMAAGLTDRVWTLREVLLFRVPPWPQPAGV